MSTLELPADLEALIRAAPDDVAGYLVAADWLQQQGNPHGRLIALACAQATLGADEPAQRHVEIAKQTAELQRQLEPVISGRDHQRVKLDWRWGFIVAVHLVSQRRADESVLLRTVLRSPRARFVRRLDLTNVTSRKLIEAVAAEAGALRCLRALAIDAEAMPARQLDLDLLWSQLDQLDELTLDVPGAHGTIAGPALVELSLTCRERDTGLVPQLRCSWATTNRGRSWRRTPMAPP